MHSQLASLVLLLTLLTIHLPTSTALRLPLKFHLERLLNRRQADSTVLETATVVVHAAQTDTAVAVVTFGGAGSGADSAITAATPTPTAFAADIQTVFFTSVAPAATTATSASAATTSPCPASQKFEEFVFEEQFANSTQVAGGNGTTVFESILTLSGNTFGFSRGTCQPLTSTLDSFYCTTDYTIPNFGTFQILGPFNPSRTPIISLTNTTTATATTEDQPASVVGTSGHFFGAKGVDLFAFLVNGTSDAAAAVQVMPVGGRHTLRLCIVQGN